MTREQFLAQFGNVVSQPAESTGNAVAGGMKAEVILDAVKKERDRRAAVVAAEKARLEKKGRLSWKESQKLDAYNNADINNAYKFTGDYNDNRSFGERLFDGPEYKMYDSPGSLELFSPTPVYNYITTSNNLRKLQPWLKEFSHLSNPEAREVLGNVAKYNNRAIGRYYNANVPGVLAPQFEVPIGLAGTDMVLSGPGNPIVMKLGYASNAGDDWAAKFTPIIKEVTMGSDPIGIFLDKTLKPYSIERLKKISKSNLAHETEHGAQDWYRTYKSGVLDESQAAMEFLENQAGLTQKIRLSQYNPNTNYNTAVSDMVKLPSGATLDLIPFTEKNKIAESILSKYNGRTKLGKWLHYNEPKKAKSFAWKSSPEEFLSETRYANQALGDWNRFGEMSAANQDKMINYLSRRFDLDKSYTKNFLTDLDNAGYASGGKIHIKPENRGKFTALKKRTGHSATWFKEHGTPAQKKMAVFALNARKWNHADGGLLKRYDLGGNTQDAILYDYFQSNDSPLADTLFIQPQGANTPAYAVKTSGDAPDPVYMPVVDNPVVSQEPAFNPMEVTNRLKQAAAYAAAAKIFQNTVPREVVNTYIRPQENTAEPEYAPSEDLIQSLIGYEGFLERPSRKIDGKWTIGYGDTDKALNDYYLKNPNKKYNKAEAEKRLRDRVTNEFLPELKKSVPNWDRLTPQQKDSLLSYAYNVGKYFTSTHKNFVSAMKDFDIVRAAKELNAGWNQRNKSTGKLLSGIRKRRIREQRAFLGDKFSVGGVIDRLKKTYSGDAKAMLEAVRNAKSETYEQM